MGSGGTSLEGFVVVFFLGMGGFWHAVCWIYPAGSPPFDPSFPCICHWETLLIAVAFHPSLTVFFFYIPVVHGPLSINRHFLRKCHLCIGIMPKWSIVSFEGNSWPWTNWKGDPFCEKIAGKQLALPPQTFCKLSKFSNWFFLEREAGQKSTVQRFWWGTPPHQSREESLPPKTFEDKCVAWHSGFVIFDVEKLTVHRWDRTLTYTKDDTWSPKWPFNASFSSQLDISNEIIPANRESKLYPNDSPKQRLDNLEIMSNQDKPVGRYNTYYLR